MENEKQFKVGHLYRFITKGIDEVVTITEAPVRNKDGFDEYGASNKEGVYRICFNDELFELP